MPGGYERTSPSLMPSTSLSLSTSTPICFRTTSDSRTLPACRCASFTCRSGRGGLSGSAGQEGSDYVGGVPIEGDPSPIIPHRGSRIGVAGGLFHVAQRYAGVGPGGRGRRDARGGPHRLLCSGL